jgi:hypothetical protein
VRSSKRFAHFRPLFFVADAVAIAIAIAIAVAVTVTATAAAAVRARARWQAHTGPEHVYVIRNARRRKQWKRRMHAHAVEDLVTVVCEVAY